MMGLEPTTFCMSSRYRLQSCAASCSGKARLPGGNVGRPSHGAAPRNAPNAHRCLQPACSWRLDVKIRRVPASYQLVSERRPDAEKVSAPVDEGELAHSVIGVLRRHKATTRSGVGPHAGLLPVAEQGVGVLDADVAPGVGGKGIDVGSVPEVKLDRSSPNNEIAVLLDR